MSFQCKVEIVFRSLVSVFIVSALPDFLIPGLRTPVIAEPQPQTYLGSARVYMRRSLGCFTPVPPFLQVDSRYKIGLSGASGSKQIQQIQPASQRSPKTQVSHIQRAQYHSVKRQESYRNYGFCFFKISEIRLGV